MNQIKKVGVSTKDFVLRHRATVAVAATAFVCYRLNRRALEMHDDFLRENDLYEKFYTPES